MSRKRVRDTEYESSLDTSAPKRRRTLDEEDEEEDEAELAAGLSDQETQNPVSIEIEDDDEDDGDEDDGDQHEDEGDEDYGEHRSGHSNGVRGHHRTNGTSGDAASSQTSSSSPSSSSQPARASQQPYDLGGDDTLEHEDLEKRVVDSIPGVIERIELENFMCHSNLEIVFNKHINFISGVNGSGKSAVLVGLALALGASTRFTNRGKKQDQFINRENNATYAKVTVTLRNVGKEAYHPELYGDRILVQRTIHKGGAAKTKLMSADRKLISDTKKELVSIMEQFGIQINNPCAILMQDTSRQYLADSSPADKYKFFLLGTQLGRLRENINLVKEKLDQMRVDLNSKKSLLPKSRARVEVFQKEYEESKELRTLEKKIEEHNDALAWRYVTEKEAQLQEKQEKCAKIELDLHKLSDAITKTQKSIDEKEQQGQLQANEVEEMAKAVEEIQKEQFGLKRQLEVLQGQARENSNKLRTQEREKQQHRRRVEQLNKTIEDTRVKLQRDTREEEERYQTALKTLQDRLASIESEMRQQEQQEQESMAQVQAIEREKNQAAALASEQEQRLNQVTRRIQELKLQKTDRLRVFGEKTASILQHIDGEAHRFKRKPIGPIGLYVTLRDAKWALAVEQCTKNTLATYMAWCQEDERMLKQIARSCGQQITILTSDFDDTVYRIPGDRIPDPRHLAMRDVIAVEEGAVMNALIDQCGIERMICCETLPLADEAVRSDPKIRHAYIINGDRMGSVNGSTNIIACRDQAKFLGVDFEQRINELEQQRATLIETVRESKAALVVIQRRYDQLRGELSKLKPAAQKLSREQLNVGAKLQQLEASRQKEQPPDISEMETHRDSYLDKIRDCEEQEALLKEQSEKIQTQMEPLRQGLAEGKARLDESNAKAEGLQQQIDAVHAMLDSLQAKAAKWQVAKDQFEKKLTDARATIAPAEAELAGLLKAAQELCPERVNTNVTSEALKTKIARMTKQLEIHSEGRRSADEVLRDFSDAKSKYIAQKQEIESISSFIDEGSAMCRERAELWNRLLRIVEKKMRQLFDKCMANKGHSGRLLFDHDKETLDIEVHIQAGMEGEQTRITQNTRTLSGGERSYTTVALLVAMWVNMEMPFNILDEFDVFMDQVVRTKGMEMLMSFARTFTDRQYVFITPQAIGAIKGSNAGDVKIIRMAQAR